MHPNDWWKGHHTVLSYFSTNPKFHILFNFWGSLPPPTQPQTRVRARNPTCQADWVRNSLPVQVVPIFCPSNL